MPSHGILTDNFSRTRKAAIGQMTQCLLSTGLTLKLAAWLQKLGQKLQANKQRSKLLTNKRWLVCILPAVDGLRPSTVMFLGPFSNEVVNDVPRYLSTCCANQKLENFEYQTSNHQKGLLWCIEQGKIIDLLDSAVILNDAAGLCPISWLAGPLWLTGCENKDETIELLTEEEAKEVMNVIEDDDALQLMEGLYLSTKNIYREDETGSI